MLRVTDTAYPLFCVDRKTDDERQYLGPFSTLDEAHAAKRSHWEDEQGPDAAPCPYVVRRCRRMMPSMLATGSFYETVLELLDERLAAEDPPGAGWADWEDTLLEHDAAEPEAVLEFWRWADKYLRLKVYLLQPPQEASS